MGRQQKVVLLLRNGSDLRLQGGSKTNAGNDGNAKIQSDVNLSTAATTTPFTMKMPRSTVTDDAKILKIEGQHAAMLLVLLMVEI